MKQLKITKFPALDYAGNEAFNTLSTNLSFAGASVKKIMITSCHAAEGKSYLSMNLMRTLAQRGIKVALVDADLRRSMVNSDYGLKYEDGRSDGKGLSHFLAGMVGMDEVIYQTDIPNAIMVPVGRWICWPEWQITSLWTHPRWAWSSMRRRSPRHVTAP